MTMTPTLAATGPAPAVTELRRRRELANFLRSKRERLAPESAGLPSRIRRRVQGLRREEVAELANISSSWYTWLEQGRPIRVSVETLERLADALQLTRDEREQLFVLAEAPPPREGRSGFEEFAPQLRPLLEKFEPWPAFVVCSRWDVVDWNQGAAKIFGDFAGLPWRERNILWLLFTCPSFRALFIEDQRMVRCVTGHFRAEFAERLGDPTWTQFVEALERASPEFRVLWREYAVVRPPDWRKELQHPQLGRLSFDSVTLAVPPGNQLRLQFYHPANEDTAAKFNDIKPSVPPILRKTL